MLYNGQKFRFQKAMESTHREIITLIISYTCVGVFVATAFAAILNVFNLLTLDNGIRRKLQTILVIEVVIIAVSAFGGFLNPQPVLKRVEQAETVNEELGTLLDSSKQQSGITYESLINSLDSGVPVRVFLEKNCPKHASAMCGHIEVSRV